jgi:two-component system OmpR family response regulator
MEMSATALRSVLYVDDEPDIRSIVQIALGLSGELTVHVGDSGAQALELTRELQPDVVLLDVMMPGLDGPATFGRMRADPLLAHIPVVFITAKAMPKEVAKLRGMGAIGVIAKPFDPMLLGKQLLCLWQDRALEDVPSDVRPEETNLLLHVTKLGERFLERSRDEAVVLRALSEHAHEGNPVVIEEIERMAHKIHGSGSMFGFLAVSACAAEIQHIAENFKPTGNTIALDPRVLQRLIECTQQLTHEVEAAVLLGSMPEAAAPTLVPSVQYALRSRAT